MKKAQCDFIYEHQVKSCPLDEEQTAQVISWMGVDSKDAMNYYGVSTCRAILAILSRDLKNNLYPREYQTTGFDRQ